MSSLKCNWGLDLGCISGKSFCGVLFSSKERWLERVQWKFVGGINTGFLAILALLTILAILAIQIGVFKDKLNFYGKGYFWWEGW